MIASDGVRVVALLDRNGLRPARFVRSRDGLAVISSEVGVVDIDPADVVEHGRIGPGAGARAGHRPGRVVGDGELKRASPGGGRTGVAGRAPRVRSTPPPMPAPSPRRTPSCAPLLAAFGYTEEELELIVRPLARDGAEPVGSMGDDASLAVLSERPRLLPSFFRQQFAQVTNPPIDPQREALVMSLRTSIGAIGNLLDERPEHCRRVVVPRPVLGLAPSSAAATSAATGSSR